MSLIKNKDGNFYPVEIKEVGWKCDYLWSSHRGCPFSCRYCSSKRWNIRFGGDPAVSRRLKSEWVKFPNSDNEYLKRFILPNASVFFSPYNDIMTIPEDDIRAILGKIYDSGEYWFDRDVIGHKEKSEFRVIFQTKKPDEYLNYLDLIPDRSWLGTTIETNAYPFKISNAPSPYDRYIAMAGLRDKINRGYLNGCKLFVTIEPAMSANNNVLSLWHMINQIKPDLTFVGSGTGEITYPEPTMDEFIELIEQLKLITHVYIKKNAKRILGNMTRLGMINKRI